VIPSQPKPGQVGKTAVYRYFLRRQVAVVVEYPLSGRDLMVKLPRRFCRKQKIAVHKVFHVFPPVAIIHRGISSL
jgi:hypothetical protein